MIRRNKVQVIITFTIFTIMFNYCLSIIQQTVRTDHQGTTDKPHLDHEWTTDGPRMDYEGTKWG